MTETTTTGRLRQPRRGLLGRLLATAAIAGLALMGAPAAQAQEPIKVGLLLTYVGGTAMFARYEDKGARLHIEQVNKAGGINGRPIEIVGYDTEGKPDRAGSLFRRLATEDKVVAVIGPDSIFVLLGMSSIPSQVKVISVAAPGTYELIAPKDRTHIVSGWAPYGYVQQMGLVHIREKYNAKRVGMITTSDTIGEMVGKESTALAKLLGMEMVQVVSQPASDRDLLPSLRKLATLQPGIDALVIFGSGPFGTIAMNQTEFAGIKVPIAYIGGNVIPELIREIAPDTGARMFTVVSRSTALDSLPKDDPYYASIQKFAADYRAKYKEEPTLPAAVGYDMALAVTDALKAVGPDPEKLRDYITSKQRDLVGIQGLKFNRTPNYGYGGDPSDLVIVNIEGGKFTFKGYLKDSLQRLGIKDEAIKAQMREFNIITQ